ncbi:cytidine deaminase [Vibrio cincinnatiensis]|uniref:cytidine deaminase n=1 Tax=Vibrio cincinnatiensis TaxID=675 RepID=UPI001EE0FD8E|nr:cytidine deaminase [Vibrio cincinnatiensis]MCG3733510.1 cytidine deaminase [Vibrio cincinnatiensis]MCG3740840.1 cytidine deaminase [Vibrio cincinnatiensis]
MNRRIEQALAQLPLAVSEYLSPIVLTEKYDATLSAEQFNQLLAISKLTDAELRVALLPLAAAYAYVPISQFYVGAIVRGISGHLYFGANMEFSGVQLGQTIHAEQAAISHAWMKGEQGITDITVNYSPCGHCRQFMNELTSSHTLTIQLPEREGKSLQYYLPESFGPRDLGITSGLMSETDHGLFTDIQEPLLQAAIQALNRSHAPYTNNLSGVALRTASGQEFSGAYAENAAFNPSLPPLQVALIQLRMARESFEQIREAALIEMSQGTISHLADTQATLEAINPDIPLSYLSL